jgi:bacillolysin
MIRFGLTLLTIMLLAMTAFADTSDDGFRGTNDLRDNASITVYRENVRGVPTYVEGNLMTDKAGNGSEFEVAISFFEANKGAFRMVEPSQELSLSRTDVDQFGNKHVRINQYYQSIPVIGGELIAHFTNDGQLRTVNGNYESYIDIDVNPVVLPELVSEIANEDLRSFFAECKPGEAELVIFPWMGTDYLAWRVFLFSNTPMGRWEYLIDAKTGEIIFKANRIMNENDIGTGTSVMGHTRSHIDTDFDGLSYKTIDYTRQLNNNPHGHDGQMPDGNYIQTNIASSSLPGSVATDTDNLWGTTEAQKSVVDGQVYTAAVYDWMLAVWDRNSFDDNGASMLTSVNYSAEGDNNAYWNGSQIVVWSWGTNWRSLAGCPDVIAHEWGHAVTDYTSDLVYQLEPGALNESFSDMMGAAFEWAHDTLDIPDWDMGENGRLTGIGFRSMDEPHDFGDPDYYGTSDPYWIDVEGCSPSYLNDYCGVHTNSGVGNKWYFLLSDGGTHHSVSVFGIGYDNAIDIAYQANAYYWTSNTNYHNAALGTLSAAMDLDPTGAWAAQVANAWNACGVTTPGPSVTFSYPSGVPDVCAPGQVTTFDVQVNGFLGGSPVSGSGYLYVSVDGGAYTSYAMTETSTNLYEAEIPGGFCENNFRFYVSADELSSGTYYDPDTTLPFTAVVATDITVVFSDNFETDQGWTVSGDATDGQWDRGTPVGGGDRGDPASDFDGSGQCYLTDNVDGNSDVDGGTTILTSPSFDLSGGDASIHYARWYSNNFGGDPYADIFEVFISNNGGASWTPVETVGPSGSEVEGGWYEHDFFVSSFVTPTSTMNLRFSASDLSTGSVVEAGIDDFTVTIFECYDSVLLIATETVPDWTQGFPYSEQLESYGGTGTITWTDLYNDLAGTGLSLSANGLLSGTPTATGAISFTAYVSDEGSESDEQVLSFNINPELVITTPSLPDWTAGKMYNRQLHSSGGTAPITWTDKNNALAGTGLSLSTAGLVSGIPTVSGTINLTARVEDNIGAFDEDLFTIQINPAVSITTASLPSWTIGIPYSVQLAATGGTGTLSWSDHNFALEGTGLSISISGLLSGTPTSEETINVTVRATDELVAFDEQAYSFTINPVVAITTSSLPDWTVGVAYSQQLISTGGTQPLAWSDKNGDLAGSGLTLSPSGLLSGTPTAAGELSFTAKIDGAAGSSDETGFTFDINPAVSITTLTLPDIALDEPTSQQLNATGGTGTLAWNDKNGDLAGTGLTLSSDGLLSGTPGSLAEITFTAYTVDQIGSSDEVLYTFNVVENYICGDANDDDEVNVSDAVSIINYVFVSGSPAPSPFASGDVNCDAIVNVSDAVWIVNYIFVEGSAAPCECEEIFLTK